MSGAASDPAGAPLKPTLVAGLCALAFATMLTYAVINSLAQVLFLSHFGSQSLPWVWLGVALASAMATAVLGNLSQRLDVVALFFRAALASTVALALILLAVAQKHPAGIFALYVYKDIYIIVLVELFWTFSNVAFGVTQASHTYGLFCAAGSLGSILGNAALALLSDQVSSVLVLWLVVPMLPAIGESCRRLAQGLSLRAPTTALAAGKKQAFLTLGCQAVRHSRYLSWLVLLVALAQSVLTLVDFQFSDSLYQTFADGISQRRVIGVMYAAINAVSFVLQLLTARWLLWAGLTRTFLVLPLSLGAGMLWVLAAPSFWSWSLCQIIGKSLDYSLFRAAKELLYIPLSYVEKTQGKAAIDILTYRVAKGLISLVILVLSSWGMMRMMSAPLALLLCALWLWAAHVILSRHRAVVAAKEQAGS